MAAGTRHGGSAAIFTLLHNELCFLLCVALVTLWHCCDCAEARVGLTLWLQCSAESKLGDTLCSCWEEAALVLMSCIFEAALKLGMKGMKTNTKASL